MAIPEQVRKMEEEAHRLQEEINKTDVPVIPSEGEAVTPVSPEGEAVTPVPPSTPSEEEAVTPVPPSTPSEEEAATTVPPKEETVEYWSHRFKVMEGKYKNEVPRLQREKVSLEKRIEFLEKQLETLVESNKILRNNIGGTPAASVTTIDPEKFKEYDPDIQALAVTVSQLQKKNAELEAAQAAPPAEDEHKKAQDAHIASWSKFEKELGELHPSWKELDSSQGFLDYLALPDGKGGIMQNHLDVLIRKYDAVGVGKFIDDYLEFSQKEPTSKEKEESNQRPKPRVSPPNSGAASPVKPQEASVGTNAKIWSRAEITQFYKDVASGKLSGEDMARKEAEINKAVSENRIER